MVGSENPPYTPAESQRGRVVRPRVGGTFGRWRTAPRRQANWSRVLRIEYRVGINVGDVIIDGEDIYGDGVNVAARLEGLAKPGGICIRRRVQTELKGKLDLDFEDLGL